MLKLSRKRCAHLAVALTFSVWAATASAQQRLTFDVASIRESQPGQQRGGIKPLPGGHGYSAQNINVKLMISLMYKVPLRQMRGGPGWLAQQPFDVEAKADRVYSVDDLHTMYQNLLADRFGLKFHKEVKEGPVYSLTIDPTGLKMTPNTSAQDFAIPLNGGPDHTVGKRVPMPYLCWFLGQVLQADARPVVNDTGLTGNYDFTLSYTPQLAPGAADNGRTDDLPSLFVAVKEQLGLKLTPQKGPVEYLVIDAIEKPSAN